MEEIQEIIIFYQIIYYLFKRSCREDFGKNINNNNFFYEKENDVHSPNENGIHKIKTPKIQSKESKQIYIFEINKKIEEK